MPSKTRRALDEISFRLDEAEDLRRPIPEASPPGPPRRLTVGMATYDDFDGTFFTLEAIHLYQELGDDVELLVVDNHPEGPGAEALRGLADRLPSMRYVPFRGFRGTAVRDLVFREAAGEVVVCVDSHVMFVPGALRALLAHFDADPDSRDLVQGPLLYEDGSMSSTHLDPVWRAGMYGIWAHDPRGDDPDGPAFEIPMHGLGVFACRRDSWPGLNPRFRGFGSEEGYLHEKFRRAGGTVLCLPALRWIHRFARPSGMAYRNTWEERIRNYCIGWSELGWDLDPITDHFREHLGAETADMAIARAQRELASPFLAFDAILVITLDPDDWLGVWKKYRTFGIEQFVERFPAVPTPENHHVGCALSHRGAIAEAKRRGLENVLVIEEDAIFLDDTMEILRGALDDLDDRPWDLFYLGGVHRKPPESVPGCSRLEAPTWLTTSHAVAYHRSVFDRVLADIPTDPTAVAGWLEEFHAIDWYLPTRIHDGSFRAFVTTPHVASQPALLNYDDADHALADRYVVV